MEMARSIIPFMAVICALTNPADAHGSDPHGAPWSYDGRKGPVNWGKLSEKYTLCSKGHKQSPVDLKAMQKSPIPNLAFAYEPTPLRVVNNGHTIQFNAEHNNTLRFSDSPEKWDLVQWHFHTPSEHRIGGREFPLEVHLVHKNAAGNLAVVGVLFTEGSFNPFLETLWLHAPEVEGKERIIEGVSVDPKLLLPDRKDYFSYEGSLTTPPCTEGVRWTVMEMTLEASKEQMAGFRKFFVMNARPTQPLHERHLLRK